MIEFEWDNAKRMSNRAKHGVDFADAVRFDLASAFTIEQSVAGEARFRSIGWIGDRLHAMVWTVRPGRVRVISLRRAN